MTKKTQEFTLGSGVSVPVPEGRFSEPGEVGFAGMVTKTCPTGKHGHVIWCVCMRTPEEKAEADKRDKEIVRTLLKIARDAKKEVKTR